MARPMLMLLTAPGLVLSVWAGAAEPAAPPANELVYEGQPATDWVKKLAGDERRDLHARRALRSLGTTAFPALLDSLRTVSDDAVLTAIRETIERIVTGDPQQHLATVQSWLKDPHAQVRATAVRLLATLRPKDAMVLFMPVLKDSSDLVRAAGVRAIEPYGADEPSVIPTLNYMLKDPHYDVRRAAVLALARYGAGNKEIADALKETLPDRDKAVADDAFTALRTMDTMAELEAKFREGDMNKAHDLVEKVLAVDRGHARANELHDSIRERLRGGGQNRQQQQVPQRPPRPPDQNF